MNDIIKQLREFSKKRGWEKIHTPQELARAAFIECAELNELYLWGKDPAPSRLNEEIADVFIYMLMLCDYIGLNEYDIKYMIRDKMIKNAIKYPEVHDGKK